LSTSPNHHLEGAELARLLEQARNRPPGAGLPSDAHPHLAVCQACREQYCELIEVEDRIKSLGASRKRTSREDCPSAETWLNLAADLMPKNEAMSAIQHAGICGVCAPKLRRALADAANLGRELTEAERQEISKLASAQPEWQAKMAERITGTIRPTPDPWWKRLWRVPALAPGLVAIILAAGTGVYLTQQRGTPNNANQLLAKAYTEQRTLELRMPDANYGPLRVQKGPAESFTARSADLLKAEALIADRLAKHPDDPAWLQSAARADVIEGKYDAAVENLRRALELKPHQPDLLLDLGTAYFQRAQSEDRQEDYGAAFEYLSQVLVQQRDNATALFNRAIVAEHQFLYRQALEDWEHYLKLDSTSQWAEEGRIHADAIRAKLKDHEAGALLTPEQIANAPGGSRNPELERRVEQYLDAAVRVWLPAAYPEGDKLGDPHARQALFFLADLTAQSHQDRWLADLLKGSSDSSFQRAVAALARASQTNNSGDYTASAISASDAAELFRAAGNDAGVLRAKFELAYSQQNTRHTDECRKNASASFTRSERMPYAWLQIQLGLEKAVCSFLGQDDWGADERISRVAMDRASAHHYNGLFVRALSFVADDQVKDGNLNGGLKSISIALDRYWSAQMPSFRAFDLYDTVASVPEFVATRPHLVMANTHEASTVLADGDYLSRAWAHSSEGRAAAAINQPELAANQYREAAKWVALAPNTEATRSYLLWTELHSADVESRLGQLESGIARLRRIQPQILATRDKYLEQAFFAALGELHLRNNQPVEAENAFAPALESAEQRLSSMNSESERISWSQEAADVYLGMAEAKLIQGQEQDSLDYFEWFLAAAERTKQEHAGYAGAPSSHPDASLLASRRSLLSARTVVAYAALPDGLATWVFDNRGIHSVWLEQSNQELQEVAARLYELTSDPRSNIGALRRDARSLYAKLVSPVEPYLEPDRAVVIQAYGWLAQIPFEALLDSNGHYWIERTDIVRSLGSSLDVSHTEIPISSEMRALVVGSTAASQAEGLVPLPNVAAEADAVARNFRAPLVLKGQEASIAAVESGLPGAAVFHFTGHAMPRPNGAALLLASGTKKTTLFGADQFRQQDLSRLQLAVLSACNTASGRDSSRGFRSIAEALQRAGVPHVVASRWAVDSVATRLFVDGFYHNLLSGQLVSEAVRQTSRSMMADPRTSHPYYWAAFSSYGRP